MDTVICSFLLSLLLPKGTGGHSCRHQQGAPEENPKELGRIGSVHGLERTWPFRAPAGFTLPVREMSALNEISAGPPSKRRGLVKGQDKALGLARVDNPSPREIACAA